MKNALVQKHYYNVGENQRQQRIFIFNPNQKREKKNLLTPHRTRRAVLPCTFVCPCREGREQTACESLVQLVLVLLGEAQSLPRQPTYMIACLRRRNRVCHTSKKLRADRTKAGRAPLFFFFFLKARNFFNFHIVRRIKRSPACLMLLWGKIGADGLWGGMFIESDPQFRDSKAFLLAHASGRDFLSQKFRRVARRPVKDCFIMRRTGRKSRWFI